MGDIERPDHNVLYVWRAEVLIAWGIILLIVLGLTEMLVHEQAGPTWLLAFGIVPVLLGAWGMILAKLRWERWTFQLNPHTLEMSHGWLVRHTRVVSRNRIQHVDFDSGPIGRKFDLVHVVVHTAGANVGTIPGVRTERAARLREELMDGPKVL